MNTLGQWILVGIAVITLLGIAVVYLHGAYDKGEMERMDRAIKSRDAEIAGMALTISRLEVSGAAQGAVIKAQGERIGSLERENERLSALRPSAEAIAALDKFIREEHDVTAKQILEIVSGGRR